VGINRKVPVKHRNAIGRGKCKTGNGYPDDSTIPLLRPVSRSDLREIMHGSASLSPDIPDEAMVVPISVRVTRRPLLLNPTSLAIAVTMPVLWHSHSGYALWFYALSCSRGLSHTSRWQSAGFSPYLATVAAIMYTIAEPDPWVGGSGSCNITVHPIRRHWAGYRWSFWRQTGQIRRNPGARWER